MSDGLLSPLFRAVAQLDDPVFLGVVWRSLALVGGLLPRRCWPASVWSVQHLLGQGALAGLARRALAAAWARRCSRSGCSCRSPR